jgi:hypothetical protein
MATDNPEKPCSRDVPEVQEQPRILTPPFPVELLNGDKLPPKTKVRYGLVWPSVAADWVIELRCFRQQFGTPEQLPKEEHFKNAAKMFFNPKTEHFIWHPWAEDMIYECCHEKFVGFAGSGSSGKSELMAIWALLNWLSAPFGTLSLVTSTSIRDAKKRVWGSIQRYWPALKPVAPGKLIDTPTPSIIAIRGDTRLEQAGVYLIPAEAKKTNEVTGKMRGMKAGRVIVVGDELSELGHAFLDTALSNLSNNPEFHMSGAANPVSYYDPFGRFVEPVNGWGSISVEDYKWRTKLGGVCLHFDAYKNPNYLARENLWPIQKWEKIEEAVERLGEDNPLFWRDYRGFWPPQAISNAIYSEAEIIRFKADQKPVWRGATQRVAGIDPSFVSGGDRCVLYLGTYGLNADGSEQVSFDKFHYIDDEASNPEPRTFQIARAIQKIITEEKVPWRNVGVDVTGGGVPFCDALATVCGSNEFLRVHFGGAPSARSLSAYDATKAEDKFVNRVTELWFGAKEFLQNGQLRGIGPDLAKEMTSRHYETRKSGTMKVRVEPKSDMKARIGRSPDIADAAFVLLDVVRERFGMRPPQEGGGKPGRQGWSSWKKTLTAKFAPRRTPQLLSMG